ncbi:MAG: Iron-sulfur protein [Dehalococcoidia bacterium]|nr:Iron-sulfur protein [Chloroflexota bacterium]
MKRLFLHLERCVGCERCELACMAAHSKTGDILFSSLEVPHPKTRIFVESINGKAVPLVCRHCEEPPCVEACMAGCMQKDPDRGIVHNMGHEQKCVGCWMCIMASRLPTKEGIWGKLQIRKSLKPQCSALAKRS